MYCICCASNSFGKPVWFLFPFVSDYGNEYCTKENENLTDRITTTVAKRFWSNNTCSMSCWKLQKSTVVDWMHLCEVNMTLAVHNLTHVVIPLEENLAMWSSKLIPPTPITSIWSAGLFRVLQNEKKERQMIERNFWLHKVVQHKKLTLSHEVG